LVQGDVEIPAPVPTTTDAADRAARRPQKGTVNAYPSTHGGQRRRFREHGFHEIGALDRLELVVLPILLGDLGGRIPLSPRSAPAVPLRLLRADRAFPDGSAKLIYAPGEPDREN
jgi:hypothetical protein